MSSLSRELVFLILQFLDEEKFKETVHKLEKESGYFFNMRHFEDAVTNGDWDEVEKYLSGFTKVDDNRYSMKIFFEIRKQKYLEALDKQDQPKALEILTKDLKVFSTFNEELFKEITLLLTLNNFRENEQLSKYGDTKSARAIMLVELKKLIEANPLFRDKLQFPSLKNSRLRTLINQSLNWQHQLCKNPKPNPDIKTLFVDHTCGQPNGARAPSPVTNPLIGSMPKVGGFPPLGAHGPFQPAPAPIASSLGGWMTNPPSMPHPAVSGGPIGLSPPNNAASMLKRPRTPPGNNPALDYQTADSEQVLKRARPFGMPEEANNLPVNILPVMYPGQNHARPMYSSDDLPRTVVANLNQGSTAKSMDFHPVQQTLLLVGTNTGDIAIWDVGSRERLAFRSFKVWDIATCSLTLQASLANECTASVNRVAWSPDGTLLGVAYSMHIIHLFSYNGGDDLRNHLEIDAHVGNVSDLAFSHPNKQLCVITCGEDKTIKVWDAATGSKQYIFEGHEAPVYSVCPHYKENIQFIFSTAVDGKIKAWLYDNMGSRVDYDAPGHSCTTMAYSADGTRLFSCGTSKDGESYIVEWNESEGAVKRKYLGLGKRSVGVVQFDTTKNRFLAAGDEFVIKFWDMDNVNLLTTIDAEGGLTASPCIRFNKEGMLLAVSTSDNGIKILANADGVRLIRATESRALDPSRVVSKAPMITSYCASNSTAGTSTAAADRNARATAIVALNGDNSCSLQDVKPRISDELEKSKIWKLTEISEPGQLRTLKLPDNSLPVRIIRLIYTNSGGAILALAYNAIHKLWKWQRTERNAFGKVTTTVAPQLWQPSSGILMTNDISETNIEEAVPCFALSKNDSYVMSASGGKISLFNMMTFKTMTTFMAPPPAATSLAFHPQDNNVIAIGMDDSSIQIYNVRVDEVKSKCETLGHSCKLGKRTRNISQMACLSNDTRRFALIQMLSTRNKEETPPDNYGPNPPPAMAEFRLEKVFPVYAVGVSEPDPNLVVSLANSGSGVGDPIWDAVREEAKSEAEKEPILSSFLYASILSHNCLEQALGFVLANRLQNATLLATQLSDIFCDVMLHDRGIQRSIRMDIQAFKDRDPSCLSYCSALLYLKGYHSLQTHRVAHALWNQGRKVLALALQSRVSEVFGVDIHPAAQIGEGILLDHATGVVIGETAVIANRVSIMQGVTLGGTGKEIGDRHPKIGQGALIGASATILGDIEIGEGAMIAAGSLVLKDIPPHSMVAGIPAKVIGYVEDQDPSLTMKHDASKEFFEQIAGRFPAM